MNISLAVSESENRIVQTLAEWVKLKLYNPNDLWASRTVHAVVTPGLCTDIILGLPFLRINKIVIDHEQNTCIAKDSNYDLLHPPPLPVQLGERIPLQTIHRELRRSVAKQKKLVMKQLNSEGHSRKDKLDKTCPKLKLSNVIAAVRERIEVLADKANLIAQSTKLRDEYKDVFDPLPHYDDLSDEIHCRVILKDASKTIMT
jgi:hypothetical protein